MRVSIILTQMGVILCFMILGFFAGKKNKVSAAGTKDLSWLVVTICGPCQALSAVLQSENLPDPATAGKVLGLNFILYAVLYLVGFATGPLLRSKRSDRKFYHVMTVFGNVGFLGLPLCEAVFGTEAMVYLTMNNLVFNILIYTYGDMSLQPEGVRGKINVSSMINPGTISAVLAFAYLMVPIPVPALVSETMRYASIAVTFLSIFIIGLNLSGVELKEMILDKQVYGYIIFRQILIPLVIMFVLKKFVTDPAVLGAFTVALSVPVANMPSIMGRVNGCDMEALTKVTVMTTFFSVISMTLVMILVMG